MLGLSELCAATSFARSAVAVKLRMATDRGLVAERIVALKGRPTARRRAIVVKEKLWVARRAAE
jgi:hypothetical protein